MADPLADGALAMTRLSKAQRDFLALGLNPFFIRAWVQTPRTGCRR